MRGTFDSLSDGVVEHPEAVLVEGFVVSLLNLLIGGKPEAHSINPQRLPPLVAHAKAFGQNRQRRRLFRGRFGAGVRHVGRGAGVAGESILLPVFLRFDGEIFTRELEPGCRMMFIE